MQRHESPRILFTIPGLQRNARSICHVSFTFGCPAKSAAPTHVGGEDRSFHLQEPDAEVPRDLPEGLAWLTAGSTNAGEQADEHIRVRFVVVGEAFSAVASH
jgi:hypothetical protein